jgi:hypothetical protein
MERKIRIIALALIAACLFGLGMASAVYLV